MTVPHDEPCPHCGREDPRTVWQQRMAQTRARTLLMSELAHYDVSTTEVAEVLAGVRPVAEVLAGRERRTAPHIEQGDQQ